MFSQIKIPTKLTTHLLMGWDFVSPWSQRLSQVIWGISSQVRWGRVNSSLRKVSTDWGQVCSESRVCSEHLGTLLVSKHTRNGISALLGDRTFPKRPLDQIHFILATECSTIWTNHLRKLGTFWGRFILPEIGISLVDVMNHCLELSIFLHPLQKQPKHLPFRQVKLGGMTGCLNTPQVSLMWCQSVSGRFF